MREEGIDKIVEAAGFEIRQPGCSACLALNDDKIPAGKYSAHPTVTSRVVRDQVPALSLPVHTAAAAAAITGKITDPRESLWNSD